MKYNIPQGQLCSIGDVMTLKKFFEFLKNWGSELLTSLAILFKAIADLQVFGINILNIKTTNEKTRYIGWIVVICLLIYEIAKWQLLYKNLLKSDAIVRIKDYGSEEKKIRKGAFDDYFSENRINKFDTDIIATFETLYIEIFNIGRSDVKKVWSNIEWINEDGKIELSHQGRWYIASSNQYQKIEDLQYIDLDSNRHSRKLHFACINKNNKSSEFYGLCRDSDGKETWDSYPNFKLKKLHYSVKITLQGNGKFTQEFRYQVINKGGNLFIERGLTEESEKVT